MTTTNTQTGTDVCSGNQVYSDANWRTRTLTIDGVLTINGDFTTVDRVVVNGTLIVNGYLEAGGALDVNGTLTVTEDLYVEDDFQVDGDLQVGGSVDIDRWGLLTVADGGSMDVSESLVANGDFSISGDVIVDEDLTVGEWSTLTVNEGGNLQVGDDFNNGGWFDWFDSENRGEIVVGGTFTNEENGNMVITDGGVLDVSEGIVLESGSIMTVEDGGTISGGAGGIVNNGGTLTAPDESECLTGCCGPECKTLPVELTYIVITSRDGEQYLEWETATEINNEGFEIQAKLASVDEFEYLDFVAGHGTTSEVQRYSYRLYTAAYKYYRLKQVDYDGQFEYSPIVALQNQLEQASYAVFPNPTAGEVHLEGAGQTAFQLYDAYGNALLSEHLLADELLEVKVSNCLSASPDGNYILTLQTAQGQESIRIVKK
ncbi:T9SS type A sorting domain-containing protein [Reichenbachiella carrageenanivorans]|uniref:T9SS type A sorting domain-containing protein n=1 Tax=Reichenbachiella carrageenanivorans TaxID=2979869 RepID=A0ABY6CVH6_9BACT|nr:T9SS type A sorting domain-containing protein [Reichenbachiella carrageenanivorans]UXX77907.1 T9SS type A sorting domain-containing protein [Reichenbachiella carrageenanivorans]